MIHRLTTAVRALASMAPLQLDTEEGRQVAGDCADALRLELDCPQQRLTADERDALVRLSDLIESGASPDAPAVIAAAQAACEALGLSR